uniref:4Fe-4S ferredoxin-type domain-containing protein n=1 Tax=Thermodesulfobium narugense TaxID=184064 RepID=A0A7C5KE22_9BACT
MRGRMCGNRRGGHHKSRFLGCFYKKNLGNAADVAILDSGFEILKPDLDETISDDHKELKKLKVAKVDPVLCKGCEICLRFCKKGAISIVDGKAFVDEVKCVGCGACARGCKNSAIKLVNRL